MGARITRFKGPVQTGSRTVSTVSGATKQTDPGTWDVEMTKRVSLSAANASANVVLPDCHIKSFLANVEVAQGGTAANQAVIKLGVAGDKVHYAVIEAVSAVARYTPTTITALSFLSQTSGQTLVAIVSVAAGAIGSGGAAVPQFSLYVNFQQLENIGNS